MSINMILREGPTRFKVYFSDYTMCNIHNSDVISFCNEYNLDIDEFIKKIREYDK